MGRLYSSNVSRISPGISSTNLVLIDTSMNVTDTLLNVNPVEAILRLTIPNGTNATTFGSLSVPFNPNNDLKVSLRSGSNQRMLMARVLQGVRADKGIFNLNSNSPEVTIPKSISSMFNNSNSTTFYSMGFIRDPKPTLNSIDHYIHSQIVGSRAVDNSTGISITYPNSSDTIRVDLPWSYVPFRLQNSNYKDGCQIYSWNGSDWGASKNCSIDDGSDEFKVIVRCNSFEIFGVGCKNSSLASIQASNQSSSGGVPANSNSSSLRIAIGFGQFLAVLIGLIL
jgi:hypothetical protein